jgi:hypothetical protein
MTKFNHHMFNAFNKPIPTQQLLTKHDVQYKNK